MSGQVMRKGQFEARLWIRFAKPAEKMLAEDRKETDSWGTLWKVIGSMRWA